MYKIAKILSLITETPLHAGTGSDLGIVDLPIQRERHTDFPKIEGSSLKGAVREAFENHTELKITGQSINGKTKEYIDVTFGPENGDLHAGALGFSDARLLLFPVKSMKGVFAWITCPRVLQRFNNDLKLTGHEGFPALPDVGTVPSNCNLVFNSNTVLLEEFSFDVKEDSVTNEFAIWISENIIPSHEEYSYWQKKAKTDIVVLSDDEFKDFVNLSTEVITRTKINNETGTVQTGALFTEEYLPTETILYSLSLATPVMVDDSKDGNDEKKLQFKADDGNNEAQNVMSFFTENLPEIMQIGGSATIGKGLVRICVVKNGGEK